MDSTPLNTVSLLFSIDRKHRKRIDSPVGENRVELDVSRLRPGNHTLAIHNELGALLASVDFHVSYPLYVVVSTDWDNTRGENNIFEYIDQLHHNFVDLKITHFFAPYHYTDPELSYARKKFVHNFMVRMNEEEGDEIGLHIHGWCHFVDTTPVTCKTKESFSTNDGTGYSTILEAYSQTEMEDILRASTRMFKRKGLPHPRSFRAGGWTAGPKVLQALANTGFNVDTSAVPAYRLSSWKGWPLYDWNMAHWDGITETSQPYYPAARSPNMEGYPSINILEVPDNGVLVDYVSAQDMKEIFNLNFPDKKPLVKPTLYQIGFHTVDSFLYGSRMRAIEETLEYIEQHSYAKGKGPAVYVNISELTSVF